MKPVSKSGFLLSTLLLLGNHLSAQQSSSHQVNHSLKKEVKMSVAQTTQENKEIVRKLYEVCLNTRKLELLKAYIAEDYVGPRGEKGPAGLEETIKPLLLGFPDIQWTVEDLIEEGDRVTVRWKWQGTHQGTFTGFPASHKQVTNQAIAIYQFRNSQIVQVWMQSDRLGFLQQIGVVSQDLGTAPQPQK